ncbi:cell death abnormality, partial [Brachionus plicatilis]
MSAPACKASMKALVPDRAMVPRLLTRSALVMPMPVSMMVRVLLALSGMILMCPACAGRSATRSGFCPGRPKQGVDDQAHQLGYFGLESKGFRFGLLVLLSFVFNFFSKKFFLGSGKQCGVMVTNNLNNNLIFSRGSKLFKRIKFASFFKFSFKFKTVVLQKFGFFRPFWFKGNFTQNKMIFFPFQIGNTNGKQMKTFNINSTKLLKEEIQPKFK